MPQPKGNFLMELIDLPFHGSVLGLADLAHGCRYNGSQSQLIFLRSLVTATAPRPGVGRVEAYTETTQKFSKSLVWLVNKTKL